MITLIILHPIFLLSMQDSFGRVSDKNKEALKASKHLTKLFPNKVTIEAPQVCHLYSFRGCIVGEVSFMLFANVSYVEEVSSASFEF